MVYAERSFSVDIEMMAVFTLAILDLVLYTYLLDICFPQDHKLHNSGDPVFVTLLSSVPSVPGTTFSN